ncbi:MAG: hypothetical protein V4635_13425 [Bacteroidota bacterium]
MNPHSKMIFCSSNRLRPNASQSKHYNGTVRSGTCKTVLIFFTINLVVITKAQELPIQKNQNDSLAIRTSTLLSKKGTFSVDKQQRHAEIEPKLPGVKMNEPPVNQKPSLPVQTSDSALKAMKRPWKSDSSSMKKRVSDKMKQFIPKGTISVAHDYGFLPYTVGDASPASAFRTEGLAETNILGIPFDVSYFYSSQKNLIGLNNYFRISYNADRYKENLKKKWSGDIDKHKINLNDINFEKQQLLQKIAYSNYLSTIDPKKWPKGSLPGMGAVPAPPSFPDTNVIPNSRLTLDTNGIAARLSDSLKSDKNYAKAESAMREAQMYKHKKDSVERVAASYKSKYDLLNDSVKKVEEKIRELERLRDNKSIADKTGHVNRTQEFLSGVRKMDIGLCYPAYSTFLVNNLPVRGVNFEYQKNGIFVGFTYGTTVSSLLYSNKSPEGLLQSARNAYNYFDANNLTSGRKILCFKFGIGEKESDHVYLGFLAGKGANNYSTQTEVVPRLVETNLVVEADIRQKLLKNTTLDIIAGKSSIQLEDLNMTVLNTAAREVFSNFRSYAVLLKLKTTIPLTKSDISMTARQVDPFFNSFGIGFMRSDNRRYELKLDQPIGKSIRYTCAARYEEDNLLKLLNYKNTFYSINNTISFKLKRSLMLRLGYTPIIRDLNAENYKLHNKNEIITGILTFSPRSRKIEHRYSLLYNNYFVNTDSSLISFQNCAYSQQVSFKSGLTTNLNVSWFRNNLKDTTGNDVFLGVLDIGYRFKGGSSVSVAGKTAYKFREDFHHGFVVKTSIKLSSMLFWETQAEKFIVGELFNGYDLEKLKKFPYCFTTKLILNF